MKTQASANTIRMSCRKVRLIADMVRGMNALEAISRLQFVRRDASAPVAQLIKSAIANAGHNHKVEPEVLWISEISVDNAGFLKRFRPRAMGRAAEIHKHLAHIQLTVSDEPRTGRAAKLLAKKADKTARAAAKKVVKAVK